MPVTTIGLEEFLEENVKTLVETYEWMKAKNMRLCESVKELQAFIDKAIEKGVCALDLETTGLNTRVDKAGNPKCRIVGISLCHDLSAGIYIAVQHKEGAEFNLPEQEVFNEIQRLCTNCTIVVHNARFDLQMLKNHKIKVDSFDKFEDTLIEAKLYDAGEKDNGLKELSSRHLNQPMIDYEEATGGTKLFDMISPKIAYIYASSDAICTLGLFEFFKAQKTVLDQRKIYNLEKRVVFTVMRMESNLINIDKGYLQEEKKRVTARLQQIEEQIYGIAGKRFNVGSSQQIGKLMFGDGGLGYKYPDNAKTASGQFKTDTATLEKIADKYPLIKLFIEYRELEKVRGTYIENLLLNCDEDSCIKLGFNQNGTDTGRFSSPGGKGLHKDGYSGVNIQSIPSNYQEGKPDIRKAFRARPGMKLVAIDFSGEELRIAANLSKEPKWVNEFLHGEADLHTATARAIFKKDKIEKFERQLSKTVNFLSLYGGGAKGLAEQAKISEGEAKKVLAMFFEGLPTLTKWINMERKKARQTKMAMTAFGRIRPLHMFYDSGDKYLEAHADRCAVNFLVQGVGADIMKTVMVRVSNWLKLKNLEDEIKILITMHDELVFEMPENKLDEYIPSINNIMPLKDILQDTLEWQIPLVVDVEYGDTWHVDHDFFKERPDLKNLVVDIPFGQATQVSTTIQDRPVQIQETPVAVSPVTVQEINISDPVAVSQIITEEVLKGHQNPVLPPTEEAQTPPVLESVSPPMAIIENTDNPGDDDTMIYTLRSTSRSSLRRMNDILTFIGDELRDQEDYLSPMKQIRICDKDGNILNVSNIKMPFDLFKGFVRYWGL